MPSSPGFRKNENMKYCYDYPRPALTVDAVVFRNIGGVVQILLIRRKNPPFQNSWCLPGGFVDMDETLEEAVKRELEEETGLSGTGLSQLHAFSSIDRDPRGRTISVVFTGWCENDEPVKGGDDAAEAAWWDIKALPGTGFDHAGIIQMAISKITGNLY